MNFRTTAIAAALALSTVGAFASTSVFDVDGLATFSSTKFGIDGIFSQTVTFSGLSAGSYVVNGDISGSKLVFTSVAVDGHNFDLTAGLDGKLRGGTVIEYTGAAPLTLTVEGVVDSGWTTVAKKTYNYQVANFSGSLVAATAPVPEPQTYALLLAGLCGVGFMTRRQRQG
ncbi:FxDxF family PEP-CTERM protein [Paucibacter sp. TC2R-5]|uniref:FxDxF family PEP-CTERM protein n=1 Tax=Paucibacter sp. TC2R-5 TaxID=2893555 RepID=UPI0021E50B21|nr:FxDxF family PEP-CTERM protein [Paucibacter sp. TC2R-5]MCV2358607.1 FxDxF family PEP-CTERM protein [Paucibacter sp. TC2R-5]